MTESPLAQGWTDTDTDAFTRYGDALVPRREEQIATVCDLLGDLPVPYVLDLCCGEGLAGRRSTCGAHPRPGSCSWTARPRC